MLSKLSTSSSSMTALMIAPERSLSSFALKKQPLSFASATIFRQIVLLLTNVVAFPTIQRQCLEKKTEDKITPAGSSYCFSRN
jgi:hypothetical protein